MKKIITIGALALSLGIVACGGGNDSAARFCEQLDVPGQSQEECEREVANASLSNDEKVDSAQEQEQSNANVKQEILSKLESLELHEYAGVENSYTVPLGSPDVYMGDEGKGIEQCSIDDIAAISEDEASLYASEDSTLVSPDEDVIVDVSVFQGSSQAKCMAAVQDALDW
jgi:hypothetical protein